MKDLDYTIWFAPYGNSLTHMWSLAVKTAKQREIGDVSAEMYAPLDDGTVHAFHLLKKTHPHVSEPVRKRDIVEIFGRDGDIDLYESLISKPIFERRTIEEQFIVLGQNAESGNYYAGSYREWAGLISLLKNFFNSHTGQMRIVLSHDPGFYWLGRVTASVDELEPYRAILTITADVEPYKYERYHSAEDWVWDDFSFIDGIIRDYRNIPVVNDKYDGVDAGYMSFEVPMRLRDVVPKIVAPGGGVQVTKTPWDSESWVPVPTKDPVEIDGIQLTGAVVPVFGGSDTLFFRKTTNDPRTVTIEMRGATL